MQSAQVASRSDNILIHIKLYLIKLSLSSESGDVNRLGYVVGDTQPLHSLDSSGRIQLGSRHQVITILPVMMAQLETRSCWTN